MLKTATGRPMELTDLAASEMYTNPYPRYEYLRREAPVSLVKVPLMMRGTGYLLTRFEDVSTLHSGDRFSTNLMKNGGLEKYQWLLPKTWRLLNDSMEFKDDPDHKRLRTLVHKAFTPKLVMGMTEEITRITEDLVERVAEKKYVDLIDDFAVQLPLTVIAKMLGVSDADRDRFHGWSNKISDANGQGAWGMLKTIPVANKLIAFFGYLAEENRLHPNDGLISRLMQANEAGDRLTDREVLAMIFLLLLAGHDTTSNLIGNSMLALLDHPDEMERLRQEPALWDTAIEELLRFTAPVACGTVRIALEDVEMSGTVIPAGSQVLGMIISANRDERVFENPDRLDVSRKPNKHLGFGFGPHYCLGHQLARTEGRIAIRALLERFDDIELTVPREQLRYKPTPSLRGLRAMPMRLA